MSFSIKSGTKTIVNGNVVTISGDTKNGNILEVDSDWFRLGDVEIKPHKNITLKMASQDIVGEKRHILGHSAVSFGIVPSGDSSTIDLKIHNLRENANYKFQSDSSSDSIKGKSNDNGVLRLDNIQVHKLPS